MFSAQCKAIFYHGFKLSVKESGMLSVGSWFKGSFTVDVSEPKPNRPNTMNLVEKRAQELDLCEDFVNGRAGLLGSGTIKGIEEG